MRGIGRPGRLLLLAIPALSGACAEVREVPTDTVRQVQIGNQVWMAENLAVEVEEGSYCYEDEEANCESRGRLYTWDAARAASETVEGWRLPSQADWETLLSTLGYDGSEGSDSMAFRALAAQETGFDLVWAGVRVPSGRYRAGDIGAVNFWSSTPVPDDSTAWSVGVMGNLGIVSPHNYPRANACSVRLIRNEASDPTGG